MPKVGLGLWKMPNDSCADAVYNAIKAGYRMLDSACDYGNEHKTGEGIKRAIDEGLCKREDLFVVSKLWNTFHRREHVKEGCQKTLKDLGLDYVDLYLIHFPIALKYVPIDSMYPPEWVNFDDSVNGGTPRMVLDEEVDYEQTWKAMEELHKEGLVKNIGFCNVGTLQIRQVLSYCTVKPAVLQVEMHPYLCQEKLLRMAHENGIVVTAFSNLGSIGYVEIGMAKAEESVIEKQQVKDIAAKHNKTPAQIILRWGVQRGTCVIPKTSKVERLTENISLFDFVLSDDEMKTISGFDLNKRYNDPGVFCEAAFGTFCPIYD